MGNIVLLENIEKFRFSKIELCLPGEGGIAFALNREDHFIYRYMTSANYVELWERLDDVKKRKAIRRSEVWGPAINYDKPIGDKENVIAEVNQGTRVVFVSNGDVVHQHNERCGIWVKMIDSRGLEEFGDLIQRESTGY